MQSEEIFTSKQLSSWGMLNKVKRELLIDERIEKIKSPDKNTFNEIQKIWLQELDINEFKLIGKKHLLWRGACGGVWAEGPHMYKKDGRYYLIIAEGGTSFNHAVMVALSDNIEGPYISNPRNPIITSRHLSYDNWVNSTGHGDILELDDGRNYMVLLGIRNQIERGSNMGRETFLVPLTWELSLIHI